MKILNCSDVGSVELKSNRAYITTHSGRCILCTQRKDERANHPRCRCEQCCYYFKKFLRLVLPPTGEVMVSKPRIVRPALQTNNIPR